MKIYLASPLFSPMEQRRNRELRDEIAHYADVFLPQEDGGLLSDMIAAGQSLCSAKRRIFEIDLQEIRNCDILLMILDGRTVDEGACVELGYAYALGKTCVGLKTDVRSLLRQGDNPMIECALSKIFDTDVSFLHWLKQMAHSLRYSARWV